MDMNDCSKLYQVGEPLPARVVESLDPIFVETFTQSTAQVFAGFKTQQSMLYDLLTAQPIVLGEKLTRSGNGYMYNIFSYIRGKEVGIDVLEQSILGTVAIYALDTDPLLGMCDLVKSYYAYGLNGLNSAKIWNLPEDIGHAPVIGDDFRKEEKYRKNVFDKILADFNGHRLVRLLKNQGYQSMGTEHIDDMLFYDIDNPSANQLIHVYKRRFDDYAIIENAAEVLDRYCVQVLSTGDSTFDFRAG